MTERIDHVAKARMLQRAVRDIFTHEPGAFAPHMGAVLLLDEARLHAQLALAEQQRITNLIAFSQDTQNPMEARDLAAIEARSALGLS